MFFLIHNHSRDFETSFHARWPTTEGVSVSVIRRGALLVSARLRFGGGGGGRGEGVGRWAIILWSFKSFLIFPEYSVWMIRNARPVSILFVLFSFANIIKINHFIFRYLISHSKKLTGNFWEFPIRTDSLRTNT